MYVWRGCAEVPADLPPTSVAVGVFDGVHRGHRILIDRVVSDAAAPAPGAPLMPVVITFDPHPLVVIRPDIAPPMLTSIPHRLELFEAAGLAGVLVIQFTPELARERAEHFAARVLAGTLHAEHVVVGRNFRFGHRAAGDAVLLTELGRELGFDVSVVDLEPLHSAAPVSSTAVRQLVAAGDVAAAADALGRPHRVSGMVVVGDRRGRELGYPTANIAAPESIAVPADGVYAGRFRVEGGPWRPAAISVGTNPTFDGSGRRVEAFVLDAPPDYDVYDEMVDVEFIERIRPMVRFDSVAALVSQMAEDVARSREILIG